MFCYLATIFKAPRLILFSLALLVCCPMLPVSAAEVDLDALAKALDQIESQIDRNRFNKTDLAAWSKVTSNAQGAAASCVSKREAELATLQSNLASLGDPASDEPADVTRKRKDVKNQKTAVEKALSSCRLLALRGEELSQRISATNKATLARQLLARGPDMLTLFVANLKQPAAVLDGFKLYLTQGTGVEVFSLNEWIYGSGLLFLLLLFAIWLRRRISERIEKLHWQDNFSERFALGLLTTANHYLPQLLVSGVAAWMVYYATRDRVPLLFVTLVALSVAAYFLIVATIRFLFSPYPPAKTCLPLTPDIARGLNRRLIVLVLLSMIGYLAFYTALSQQVPEAPLLLARGVFSLLLVLNMVWALWLLFRSPKLTEIRWIIIGVILILTASLIAEWLGYRNLAYTTRQTVIGTLAVFGLALLLSRLFRGLFDAIDAGAYGWCRKLKQLLAVKDDGPLPGVIWLRFVVGVLIWIGFGMAVLRLFDVSDEVVGDFKNLVMHGFTIGSMQLIPIRLFWAAVIFAILLTLSGWVRSRLDKRWLQKTRMDRGAREAMVTISGYLMIAIAALVALSIAGLNFSNLAIIAGALSVGIGFGLQNVVNNFVSGLILLFERPIKTGDWVVVGQTEGYVKRIRIRATQIQTFDRSDVIVPNSELISQQVTNWMLESPRGRVKIPVGVAYGSDTDQVRDILLKLAEEHPRVVQVHDTLSPKPRVLFRAFGDSSLDFELRVFIYNIDERISVTSDLNFAIDRAFREAGIEIPFPQRDVHMRD